MEMRNNVVSIMECDVKTCISKNDSSYSSHGEKEDETKREK